MRWYNILILVLLVLNIATSEYRISLKQDLIEMQDEYIQLLEKDTTITNGLLAVQNTYIEKLKQSQITTVTSATVTSYSPRKGETDTDPYITASMLPVREGCVAVSRDLFYQGWAFGRKVYIEGEGIFTITDLMHARKTKQIDIFRFSTTEALKFGRQQRKVVLLGE